MIYSHVIRDLTASHLVYVTFIVFYEYLMISVAKCADVSILTSFNEHYSEFDFVLFVDFHTL